VLTATGRARQAWKAWESARTQQQHERRRAYLQVHILQMSQEKAPLPVALPDDAFAQQCVAALKEGVNAVRLLGVATPLAMRLSLSTDCSALSLVAADGAGTVTSRVQIRLMDLTDVHFGGALTETEKNAHPGVPMQSRFRLVTANSTEMQFAIADTQQLQHAICGLRHLAHRPMQRGQVLWQRFLHTVPPSKLKAATFEERLDGGAHTESLRSHLSKIRTQVMSKA